MAGIRMENKIYEVGMYCRLSKDDGTDNESASIATQKSILTDYVKKQGWHLAKTYVDDGYSGTNFQRPSFQNMIKDIESGLINCVITKDLSRLGRNYLDCGLYLEVFFPEHNVRYIAVNDGVDTLNKSAMDITPFRNILNEMYSADVSVKIKSAYRARFQQGKFMGTTAPYGYVKDPADHNHLLIDDKVAHVVREIFDLALAGNGIAKIRKHINKQHILRPAAYAAEQGATGYERYFEENEENRYIWSENSVRGILRSPIYAGNLAGYKRIAANMKSKKRPSKLPEEWEVIPDTHEGIVTQEEFDTVQQLITSRRLPENKGGFENIFAGVIKCADCGYAMRAMSANRRKRPDIIDCVQYSCNNYGRYGNIMCTAHSIEARDLFNAVLTDINRFADMAVNDEKAVRAIEKRLTETDQSKAKALEKEQRKLNKRLAELDRLFSSLYEDKVMERITERNFEMMSGKYQKEQLEIEARLKEVTETLSDSYEKTQGVRDFLSLIRNYQGIKELDATIINALIDKILVSEREKLTDGMVRQEIKIYYKFIGFVGELHITPTKRWTALKPKNCTVCGVEYVPRSGISKYCPACAKKIQREKSNESKRRSRERNRQACIELSAKNDRLKPDIIQEQPVADEDFSSLLAGNLTKEELQLVLTYGPSEITDSGYPHSESLNTLNSIWQGDMSGNLIEKADYNTYNKKYLLSDVNRLFSLFTDFQFTENNDYDTETGPNVDGEYIIFIPATLNYSVETQIHSAVYTPEEIRIQYTYTKQIYEEGQPAQTSEKEAILQPNVQGLYQIVRIGDISTEESPVEKTPEKSGIIIEDANDAPSGMEDVPQATDQEVMALYTDAVNASAAGTDGYIFYDYENLTGEREYALYDIDQNGIAELILRESINEGPFFSFVHRVYTVADNGAGYELVMIEGIENAHSFTIPTEGEGLYAFEFFRGNGEEVFYRVILENGTLVRASQPERVTTLGDEDSQTYWNQNPHLTWYAVTDLSGLAV